MLWDLQINDINSTWKHAPYSDILSSAPPHREPKIKIVNGKKLLLNNSHTENRRGGNLLNGLNDDRVFMQSGQAQGIFKVGDTWLHISKFH